MRREDGRESVKRLEKEIDLIVGDVLISSGAVAYLGPFTVCYHHTIPPIYEGLSIFVHQLSSAVVYIEGITP